MGEYSTLELLLSEKYPDSKLKDMVDHLPIRKETVIWKPTQDANYAGRDIFESPLNSSFAKTTLKESYILTDPHPDLHRQPQVANKDTQVNIGKATSQEFSGEFTALQKAQTKVKVDKLYKAVIEALETANDKEIVKSDLGDKVLDFLF